jgi:hypothetical protein
LPEGEDGRKRPPVEGRCANHFEMAFTDSEVLMDFGQAYDPAEPWIHTRIIMSPKSAKMVAQMMQELMQQFDQAVAPTSGGQS